MTSKIKLPNVTLFGIDAANPAGLLRAADICREGIDFGGSSIITKRLFPGNTLQQGRENYSMFMIEKLNDQFQTSHVLTIHADGYVVNPSAWTDSWLDFDYIGSTWLYKDNMNVGNGGFSLRSKKLCSVLASMPHSKFHPEDHQICRVLRPTLEKYGIRFAPEEVANKFAIEAYGSGAFIHEGQKGNLYSGQFGFHSVHCDFRNYSNYNIDPSILLKRP